MHEFCDEVATFPEKLGHQPDGSYIDTGNLMELSRGAS